MSVYNINLTSKEGQLEVELVDLRGPKGDPFTYNDFT